jgi:hypothetical protein
MADRSFFLVAKQHINRDNLVGFRHLVTEYLEWSQSREYTSHARLFRDLFVHMCLRGRLEMAQEFIKFYQKMSPVDQIGLAPTFGYCRVIARKRKDQKMVQWLEQLA